MSQTHTSHHARDLTHPLQSLLQAHCPNGVEFKTLGEVCELKRGRVISKKYLNDNAGEYPVYSSQTQNDGIFGHIDSYDFEGEFVSWTTDGANAGSVFYINGKFSVTNVCGLLNKKVDSINMRFLYFVLSVVAKQYVNFSSPNPKLMSNKMAQIKIPLPPLAVQEKIVEILDTFTELQRELQRELHARRKQYEYYRNKLLSEKELNKRAQALGQSLEFIALDEICEVKRGVRVTKKDLIENGKHPVFQNCLTPMGYYHQSNVNADTPFIIVGGSAGEIGWSSNKYWAADDCVYFVCQKSLMSRFLYHTLCSNRHYFLSRVRTASIPRLSQNYIKNFKIPLPPLAVQNEIVEILDKFHALVNDLVSGIPAEIEARKKQYEYYREQLLSFKEMD